MPLTEHVSGGLPESVPAVSQDADAAADSATTECAEEPFGVSTGGLSDGCIEDDDAE